jgi:hypothetical protein
MSDEPATFGDFDSADSICEEILACLDKLGESPAVFGLDNLRRVDGAHASIDSLRDSLRRNRPYAVKR